MTDQKVYIINKGCHDFSKALSFGTPIFLTKGKYNLLSIGRMYRSIIEKLKDSSPEDSILICGPTIMNVIATSIFTQLHGRVNLLIYCVDNNGAGYYKRRTIILNNPTESNDEGDPE